MAATTTLLGLLTPTQGTLSGTWGDSVNYGISDYVDIAIAGTLSFAGDGAITLANTTGSSSGNAITSTTAQYMVIRITGTQTVTKVITGPSYSKLYMVDHAGATSAVTFKASGQTGVSIAVGEKAFVYYNGTDYVKVSSIGSTGILSPVGGGTGVSNNAAMTVTGSGNFAYTRTLTGATNVTFPTTGTLATLAGSETFTNKTLTTPIISSISNTGTLTLPTSTDTLVGRATTDTLTNKTLTNPTVTNYVETPYSANSSTAITLALTNGTVQIITLTGNATITMPTAVSGKSFIMFLRQDATGSRTVTWSTVNWPGGTAPTITSTASKQDIYSFFSDGTSWYGVSVGANYTQ
jgi:hypothetical protein